MITEDQWVDLRPKRAAITAALEALGIPINGWANDRPNLSPGYKANWDEIEQVALGVTNPLTKRGTKKARTKK